MASQTLLRIVDAATGEDIGRCTGPAADGSCPRVAVGNILPCSGCVLVPLHAAEAAIPYAVSGQATLCPVTVAAALAVTPDNLLS